MKRFMTALMLAVTLCSVTLAQTNNIAKDTIAAAADSTQVVEYTDSVISTQGTHGNSQYSNLFGSLGPEVIVPIVAIVFGCGVPILIVFFAFYFRYKNRQAKYKLVEEALRSGQPLPESIFKNMRQEDTQSKGIKNTFTGIGLFVFLWAITGEFSIASIGLLVMFIGIGQWLIDLQKSKKENASPFNQTDKDNHTESK